MLQIWLLGVEVVPVYALAMGAALVLPVGDRALIEAVGGDDGLGWAARAEEGDDDDEQGAIRVQAVEGRTLGGSEGRAAGRADEAALCAGVNFDVTLVGQPPGRAVGVEAGYTVGVQGRFLRGAMTVASPLGSVLDPFLATRTPFHGSLGCYLLSVRPPELCGGTPPECAGVQVPLGKRAPESISARIVYVSYA
jgi:hypothetical protein